MFEPIQPKDFMNYYNYISQLKSVNLTPETCLGRCLLGQYFGLAGFDNGKCAGIIIHYMLNKETCKVVYLHAVNAVNRFKEEYYKLLKADGIRQVQAESEHNEKAYERLMGMKKLYTVYGRTL